MLGAHHRRPSGGPGRVVVLTGPPGSGKTTCCSCVAELARRHGLRVRGLVSPLAAAPSGGAAVAARWRELLDLGSGRRRILAAEMFREPADAATPRWRLFDDALSWGDAVLATACPTDVLVIDELGPVELLHRRGWYGGARLALAGAYRVAIVVVRPWLLPRARGLFSVSSQAVVDVTGRLPARVAQTLLADLSDVAAVARPAGVQP